MAQLTVDFIDEWLTQLQSNDHLYHSTDFSDADASVVTFVKYQ